MPYYPKEIQDKINQEISLYELMQHHGENVKKGLGKSAYFLCPKCGGDWENGRINLRDNYFKCFKCHAQGDQFQGKAINYIQYKLNLNLIEAIEYLAKEYNISINSVDNSDFKRTQQLFKDVVEFYKGFTDQTSYFADRGISSEIVKRKNLGYAPGGYLKMHLLQKGYKENELSKNALINNKGLDSWFHRIIVPIYKNGYIVDFYTRRTDGKDSVIHLYQNGKNTLYGYDDIKDSPNFINFVEAPISKLVAESNGFVNHVSLGSCMKWGKQSLNLIRDKKPKGVRIIFDNDENGQGQTQAFEFGQYLVENNVNNVYITILPHKCDPADVLVGYDRNFYLTLLERSVPFSRYKAHFLMKDISIEDITDHLYRRVKNCHSSISQWETFHSLFS
jgi:DNA primase